MGLDLTCDRGRKLLERILGWPRHEAVHAQGLPFEIHSGAVPGVTVERKAIRRGEIRIWKRLGKVPVPNQPAAALSVKVSPRSSKSEAIREKRTRPER